MAAARSRVLGESQKAEGRCKPRLSEFKEKDFLFSICDLSFVIFFNACRPVYPMVPRLHDKLNSK